MSIGVPLFNEARFVDESLWALRRQDYPNLEIIISDNASTDGTVGICQRHAAADSRIRLVRADVNVGATANFQRVLDLAAGEYFMWASGHDLWTPDLVSSCAAILRNDEGACLAFGGCEWIDAAGQPLARSSGWSDTRGMDPVGRFFTILWGNMHPVLGLMRTSRLRESGPLPNHAGADLVLLARLVLHGDFVHATQARWFRREFRAEVSYEDKLRRYASADARISRSFVQRMFPLLQLPFALLRELWRADLPLLDRVGMAVVLVVSLPLRYRAGRRVNAR